MFELERMANGARILTAPMRDAASVAVPDRTPALGFVPIASVMLAVDEVTVFPAASAR